MHDDPEIQTRGIDAVLRELLKASYGLFPDGIEQAIAESVERHTGAREVRLLLVDLDQVELRPIGRDGSGAAAVPVDDSTAGLAFREERPVIERTASGRRLWLPVLDSAERLGVLHVVDDDTTSLDDWLVLTSLVGELVTSKEAYGDAIVSARRQHPVSVAAEMRWSTLPPLTFTSREVTVAGILQPSHLVAGDAFDYAVDRGTVGVALFDAMGHGLEASRIANLALGCFRNGRRQGSGIDSTFSMIDEIIASAFGGAKFTTALHVQLDLESGMARVHSAGHLPPVVLRTNGAVEPIVVRPRPPLGVGAAKCRETVVQLQPGDVVLLHSDGVSEARSPTGDVYGMHRMATFAQSLLAAGVRPAEVVRRVMRDAIDHQADHVRDDATLVLVRWRPAAVQAATIPTAADAVELGAAAS